MCANVLWYEMALQSCQTGLQAQPFGIAPGFGCRLDNRP